MPSSIDLREWKILAADRVDGRPLLALIVGCHDLHVEYMLGTEKRATLEHAEAYRAEAFESATLPVY